MGSGYEVYLEQFEELFGMSLFSMLITEIPSMLMNVAIYIFTALALYTIAKRRGIKNPWLAWLPIVNVYIIGCISDQYRQVARGETKSRRKTLLGLNIANTVLLVALVVLALNTVLGAMFDLLEIGLENLETVDESAVFDILMPMISSMAGMFLLLIPCCVISIVYLVFYCIALHDVFKSCDPNNATLYLVLGILFDIALPIFLFICRNKDDGMPARQEEQPQYEVPQWQPIQPPAEPWEQNDNQ